MQPIMERSPLTSGRSATPADINRYGWPTSIGTGGRHQSECPADIIGMRTDNIGRWESERGDKDFHMAIMARQRSSRRLRELKKAHLASSSDTFLGLGR